MVVRLACLPGLSRETTSMLTSPAFLLLLLPAHSLSATELLLEPSGGKAILVDTSLLAKRSPTSSTVQTSQPSQDTPQVRRELRVKN